MSNFHELVKEPESIVPIRFQDCDPFGHLNNARYIDYFLNARMDHLQHFYGVNLYDRNQPAAASWVIKKNQIAYLRPALLGENVRLRTRLIHFTDNTIVIEGLMLDNDGQHLKAIIWVEMAYVSLVSGRPTNHPEHWLGLLRAAVVDEGYDAEGFNRRVETARQHFRQRLARPELAAAAAAPA